MTLIIDLLASGSPEPNFPRSSDPPTWSSRTKKSSLSTLSSIFSSPKLHPWDPKMEWNPSNKFQAAPRWQQMQQIHTNSVCFLFQRWTNWLHLGFHVSPVTGIKGCRAWNLGAFLEVARVTKAWNSSDFYPLNLSPNKIPKRTLVFWICSFWGAIFGGIGYEGDGTTVQESRQATCACKHRCNFPIPRLTTSRNGLQGFKFQWLVVGSWYIWAIKWTRETLPLFFPRLCDL